jgi:hypothetical protein
MKTKITTILLALIFGMGYGQNNRSNGAISNTIAPTLSPPLPPGNTEAFRFRPGLITQLDSGTAFDFATTSQWNSFGRLSTAGQTLFGYRTQRAGRGLIFGFSGDQQTTTPTLGSPVIEWLGNGTVTAGDLLFRTSPSVTSANSTQVMRMKSDGNTLFSTGSSIFESGVYINSTLFPDPYYYGNRHFTPKVEINNNNDGLAVICNASALDLLGGTFHATNSNPLGDCTGSTFTANSSRDAIGSRSRAYTSNDTRGSSYGIISSARGGFENYGVYATTSAPLSGSRSYSYGIYADATGSFATDSFTYGVYAKATGFNPIAGYFDGQIFSTSSLIVSDVTLKKDIVNEKSTMPKINKLKPVTYNMIQDNASLKMSLPNKLQHGFVAQDLELVYPELVEEVVQPIFDENNKQTGTKKLKSVNYIGLISVLTQALQEMSSEMTILKEKMKTLEGKNGTINAKTAANKVAENDYLLSQNTPNPFNSSTVIEYSLPTNESNAALLIFNFSGETIKEYKLSDAKGTITIDAAGLLKGIYFYALVVNGQEMITKKMIVN